MQKTLLGRLMATGSVLLVSVGLLGQSRPTPKVTDYLPPKQGNSWTYIYTAPGMRSGEIKSGTIVITARKTIQRPTETVVFQDIAVDGKVAQTEKYRITAKELLREAAGWKAQEEMIPPIPLLRLPLLPDKQWTWQGKVKTKAGSTNAEATISVSEAEEITLPVGKVLAIQIHLETVLKPIVKGKTQRITMPLDYWFVAGTGLVQQKLQLPLGSLIAQLKHTTLKK